MSRRVAFILAGAISVVVIGLVGTWLYTRSVAEHEAGRILEIARAAGLEVSYEALEITGFPIARGGRFTNLSVRAPGASTAFAFPTAEAGLALTDLGAVDIALPAEFTLTRLDASGSPTTDEVVIASENLRARLRGQARGGRVVITAERLRVAADREGRNYAQTTDLSIDARAETDQQAGEAMVRVSMTAGALEVRRGPADAGAGGQVGAGTIIATGVTVGVDSSSERVSANAAFDRVVVDDGLGGAYNVAEARFTASLAPETRFDLAPVFTAPTQDDPFAGLGWIAAQALAERGVLDVDLSVASADVQAPRPETENAVDTMRIGGFSIAADVTPTIVSARLGAARVRVDSAIENQPSATEIEALDMTLTGAPAERYDFTDLLRSGDLQEGVSRLATIIRRELRGGGAVDLRIASDRFVTDQRLWVYEQFLFPLFGDFTITGVERIRENSGANEMIIAINAEEAALALRSTALAYEFEGGAPGAMRIEAFDFRTAFPLRRADAPTPATISLSVADLMLDQALWNALELGDGAPEPIPGLRFDGALMVTISDDLLAERRGPEALPAAGLVLPQRFVINEGVLELLSLRAEATGGAALAPEVDGEILIATQNGEAGLNRMLASPLAQWTGLVLYLRLAQALLAQYGAPGESEGLVLMNVEFDPQGVRINGEPFELGF